MRMLGNRIKSYTSSCHDKQSLKRYETNQWKREYIAESLDLEEEKEVKEKLGKF